MITVDAIMATRPCESYPRAKVDQLIAQYGPFPTWESLATVARDAGWPVEPSDLLRTAYRAASPSQCELGVRHSTKMRVEAQIRRCQDVAPAVSAIRSRLLAWAGGGSEDIAGIRRDAYDTSYSAYVTQSAYSSECVHPGVLAAVSASYSAYSAIPARTAYLAANDAYVATRAASCADSCAAGDDDATYDAADDAVDAVYADTSEDDLAATSCTTEEKRWQSILFICRLLDESKDPI